ncbi:esterase [Prevotella sp. E13-17]|uniref:YqiA/YcfP family alpha/beta fold hydrolase n=1 Tax=Prevotella sp. E13-17 TaxID=2913616 RepID=UPI001EDA5FDE|nr:YqiA/YcfP family alpha/beta fold hydrolase [Prevotella sp. E13-17]UKK51549.1 esterase [Prevotella sp. E13-17]
MENPYVKQYPELLEGKTLIYVHGFGSSGQSGTVTRLRTVFPNTKVVAPDLPVDPFEAMTLLKQLCADEQPSLILGTSMGGMYTEQLYGFDRICMNPAMCIADTMQAHGMTGTQTFQNPRLDGVNQFYVDKALVKAYRTVSEQRFANVSDEERQRVYGLFGDRDEVVDTFDMFQQHYPNAIHFHGEHRMDDRSFMHSVVPVIRWIDDRQEKRERPIVYIGVECLWDDYKKPASSSQKTVRQLIEKYQVFFVAPSSSSCPAEYAEMVAWLQEYFDVMAWGHTIFTNQRHLLYGDYLIEKMQTRDSMATRLEFGSDTFKTWEAVLDYFSLLGGQ